MKESVIQKGVLDYLVWAATRHKIYWFRAGVGTLRTASGRVFKTGKAGCPDIVCVFKSRFIGLEIKTLKGRQSSRQKEAQAEIEAAGGEYYIIRSIADVKKIIPIA